MSGIVGSKLNIRGSGLVGSLGTDGQHMLSAGAGKTNVFETVAAGGGKVGQVIQTLKVDTTSSTSTTFTSSGLAVAITPVATESKVLLFISFGSFQNQYSGMLVHAKIDGGNCATYIGDADTGYESAMSAIGTYDTYGQHTQCMMYLDAPDTTSEVTYTMHWACSNGTSWMNRAHTLRTDGSGGNCATTFVAMEILE